MRKFLQFTSAHIIALLLHFSLYAQQLIISGTVQGIDGPLQGATVLVNKSSTVTNKQGRFSVALDSGKYIFYITHTGYEKIIEEVKIDCSISLEFVMTINTELTEVTVVSSRFAAQRSNHSSLVPVDIVSSQQLLQTGQTSPTQMLQFTVPSFNASR